MRMRACAGALISAVCMIAGAPAAALADPQITAVPPAPSYTYPGGNSFLVAVAQPTLELQASGGASLVCSETGSGYQPCAPAQAPCPTALCASYTPPTPWTGTGFHDLHVEARDASGKVLGQQTLTVQVDTTPPDTTVRDEYVPGTQETRPQVDATAVDELGDNASDTFQCAFGDPGASATFSPCGRLDFGATTPVAPDVALPLPLTYHPYAFQVRAVDRLGRVDPTPATLFLSPMPCRLTLSHTSLRRYATRGLPVRLDCARAGPVFLTVALRGFDGHDLSVRRAFSMPLLNNRDVPTGLGLFSARVTLQPPRSFRRLVRHHRFADLALQGVNIDGITEETAVAKVRLR